MTDVHEDFDRARKYLSQQTYPGSTRVIVVEEKYHVGGPEVGMNHGTALRIECPECGRQGNVVMWHGTNNFWDCPDCGQKLSKAG